jgi:hypothetical protein
MSARKSLSGAGPAAVLALTLLLAACQRSDQAAGSREGAPSPPPTATPAAPGTSVPGTPPRSDASQPPGQSASNGRPNGSETAKGSDAPMKPMDKNEEANAMPQPGQVNDHSTLAQDPKLSTQEPTPSQ